MLWYVASPYSKYPGGIVKALEDVSREMGLLVRAGVHAFSPICHSHPIAIHGGIDPLDHETWMNADEPFMKMADGLIVLMIDGWDESKGVQAEIDMFDNADKPVIFMRPGILPEFSKTSQKDFSYSD